MKASGYFPQPRVALLFALPQLLALALFFYWPALQAIWWSFHLVLPFGGHEVFVGLSNYWRVLGIRACSPPRLYPDLQPVERRAVNAHRPDTGAVP